MAHEKHFVPDAATSAGTHESHASASQSKTGKGFGSATTATGKVQPLTLAQEEILTNRGLDIELITRMGWRSSGRSGYGEEIMLAYVKKFYYIVKYEQKHNRAIDYKVHGIANRLLGVDGIIGRKGLRSINGRPLAQKGASAFVHGVSRRNSRRIGFRPSMQKSEMHQSLAFGACHAKGEHKAGISWALHAPAVNGDYSLSKGARV